MSGLIFHFLVIWGDQNGMGVQGLIWGLGRSPALHEIFELGGGTFVAGTNIIDSAFREFLVPVF